MSSIWAEGPLTLHLPQGLLEFELLEISKEARVCRPGSNQFEPLPSLDGLWYEAASYDDREEVAIAGPLSFRVGDGPVIELPAAGSLMFGCDTDGEPTCSLLDRDRKCAADHWKGHWRRQGDQEGAKSIQIGLSQRLFGKDAPLLAIVTPGILSRPSSLAERVEFSPELAAKVPSFERLRHALP